MRWISGISGRQKILCLCMALSPMSACNMSTCYHIWAPHSQAHVTSSFWGKMFCRHLATSKMFAAMGTPQNYSTTGTGLDARTDRVLQCYMDGGTLWMSILWVSLCHIEQMMCSIRLSFLSEAVKMVQKPNRKKAAFQNWNSSCWAMLFPPTLGSL